MVETREVRQTSTNMTVGKELKEVIMEAQKNIEKVSGFSITMIDVSNMIAKQLKSKGLYWNSTKVI